MGWLSMRTFPVVLLLICAIRFYTMSLNDEAVADSTAANVVHISRTRISGAAETASVVANKALRHVGKANATLAVGAGAVPRVGGGNINNNGGKIRASTAAARGAWGADDDQAPDLDGLARLLDERLKFVRPGRGIDVLDFKAGADACGGGWQFEKSSYLSGCCSQPPGSSVEAKMGAGCQSFKRLADAKKSCDALGGACCGVVAMAGDEFQCRESCSPRNSPAGEDSYIKLMCGGVSKDATPLEIWSVFQRGVQDAIENPKYRLDGDRRHLLTPGRGGDAASVKDDGTIFLTVAAYRDWNCDMTIGQALRHAKEPDRIHVAIVEMNCRVDPCVTGTGWGNTRRIVPAKPDEDCYDELMKQPDLSRHLKAGRVKTLRLNESQALGPFFSRYLATKMFQGQSYIVQVDAHSKFLDNWDALVISQLKKTPSFPRSIISNYPPSAVPSHETPSALCSVHFADGIVRLDHGFRRFKTSIDDRPRHSMYVAAGFFAAHASLLTDSPFDPYLPFIFMGEEITMSARFWTSGWDIYAPSMDVVSHEYVRKESPKYWETVDRIYGTGTQNAIVPIVMQRIRNLLKWPNDPPRFPTSLLYEADKYGLGKNRSLESFWENGGIDLEHQRVNMPHWCLDGKAPKHVLVPL
eukprot:TRINITY_DN20719_c0_g1_i1.p1 TRINITY_DN20719_c0_g1~~TRINITY_DN20719_c0_g1_i1.p1  ORF type:complete len:639 (+),score=102.05 TRINITY_DN20719_c0_g1_i1:170-2086(+)